MLTPVMSDGIRSGVNWIRRNSSPSARLSDRTSNVLAVPGRTFQEYVPAGQQRQQHFAQHGVLAEHHTLQFAEHAHRGGRHGCARRRWSVLKILQRSSTAFAACSTLDDGCPGWERVVSVSSAARSPGDVARRSRCASQMRQSPRARSAGGASRRRSPRINGAIASSCPCAADSAVARARTCSSAERSVREITGTGAPNRTAPQSSASRPTTASLPCGPAPGRLPDSMRTCDRPANPTRHIRDGIRRRARDRIARRRVPARTGRRRYLCGRGC